jgi:chemotaxis protein methyltransferase CheR
VAADAELEGLLDAVLSRSGIDFRGYARSTVERRIRHLAARDQGGGGLAALRAATLADPACAAEVVAALSVCVTSMFRDADFFLAFRRLAVPRLRALGPVRAWHAGCGTGEEVWSHAIALREGGAAAHARLYGTDVRPDLLAVAQAGLLPLDRMREYTLAYQRSGGVCDFSAYYAVSGERVLARGFLRRAAVFGRHDVTADPPLGTFEAVFCRNVLIYLDPPLQDRVHRTLAASLVPGGVLALGHGEALSPGVQDAYEPLDERNKIYVRVPTPAR